MKKKFIILVLIVIVLLLIIGGVFLWPYYKQIKIKKDLERLADYVVEETSEGKIIESKDGKLKVKVPEGWRFREELKYLKEGRLVDSNYFVGHIEILSPELFEASNEGKETNIYKSKTGCLIEIAPLEGEKSLEDLKEDLEKEIKENYQYLELESEATLEIIEIDGRKAFKNMFTSSLLGNCTSIVIPIDDGNHILKVFSSQENKDKCSQEFNKFLETVSIE